MLYPGERWRFGIAAVASIAFLLIIVAALISAGVGTLVGGVIGLAVVVASVWWVIQLRRASLLGNALKVTPMTFPSLQLLLDDVCEQLGFYRRIEVYVTPKGDPPVNLVTYLGTHIILIEGGLVAELLDQPSMAQLKFLIARHVGALKARQYRLDVLLVILGAANALQFVKPFLLPYYRATAYSGDQIGLACCGSLEAALEATARLIVGKELAPELPLGGVVPQAALVKERIMPRLAQFLSPAPHVINRYLNLLMYGRADEPESTGRLCSGLGEVELRALEELWRACPHHVPGAFLTGAPRESAPSVPPRASALDALPPPAPEPSEIVRPAGDPDATRVVAAASFADAAPPPVTVGVGGSTPALSFPPPEYPPPDPPVPKP
jgi:Zn-dependent protease with chaperone function